MADLFYVDVTNANFYNFYYNMVAEVNKEVITALQSQLPDRLMTQKAMNYRNNVLAGGLAAHHGPGEFGVMANRNISTGELEFISADQMAGICATVSRNMAEEIVERAKYYCPIDTSHDGLHLRDCFRIEDNGDGKCTIYNDMPYAWYVEEFTWKKHDYPTQAKFLTTAVYEIQQKYGFGWA